MYWVLKKYGNIKSPLWSGNFHPSHVWLMSYTNTKKSFNTAQQDLSQSMIIDSTIPQPPPPPANHIPYQPLLNTACTYIMQSDEKYAPIHKVPALSSQTGTPEKLIQPWPTITIVHDLKVCNTLEKRMVNTMDKSISSGAWFYRWSCKQVEE